MRLNRLLQIISLLRGPSSWNARRLSDHFNTSRRNIHRDLAILELAGVPYYYDPDFGNGGGYRIRPEWWFPHVGLTDQECVDLAVLTRVAESQSVPLLDQACEVRDKLLGTLPIKQQELIREASELFETLSLRLAEHSHSRKIMRVLQEALLTKRRITGLYRSPHEKRSTRLHLHPLRIFLAGQAWYLAANDDQGKVRIYRVARFQELKTVSKPSVPNPNFGLRELLGNAWTVFRGERDWHIELKFDAESAELVAETCWHHTQEIVPQKDGSVLFRVTVSGLEEIRWWILGWGPRVKVIRPVELAQEIRKLLESSIQQYRSGSKPKHSI